MKRIFAHVPYLQMQEHLPFILERHLSPEIYFSADALDGLDQAKLV